MKDSHSPPCKSLFRMQTGLSLIDLMMALSIFMLLTMVAVPASDSLLKRNAQRASTQTLVSAINFTRLQAVTTGMQAVLCPTTNTETCSNDWNHPLMIFNDTDGDRSRSESEPILRHITVVNGAESLSWGSFGARSYLHFDAQGATEDQNGTFYYCDGHENTYKAQVKVSKAGRARLVPASRLRDRC